MTTLTTAPVEFSLHHQHAYDRSSAFRWVWSHASRHGWIIFMMVIGAVGNAGWRLWYRC